VDSLAIFSQLLPLFAGLHVGRSLPKALRFVVLVFVIWFAQDCVMWWLAKQLHRNNLWVGHVMRPVWTGLLLWAFSLWQKGDVARMAFRLAIPFYGVAWLALQLLVERADRFSKYASPLSAMLLVCVAAYTLVAESLRAEEPVWRTDWLWVSVGMLLKFCGVVVLMPLSNLMLTSPEDLRFMYQLYGASSVVATLFVTGGVLCARPHPSSGGSSWPRLSWRPFSSPRS
jgi:hypothetical protein